MAILKAGINLLQGFKHTEMKTDNSRALDEAQHHTHEVLCPGNSETIDWLVIMIQEVMVMVRFISIIHGCQESDPSISLSFLTFRAGRSSSLPSRPSSRIVM
jgi:hypothetical protein